MSTAPASLIRPWYRVCQALCQLTFLLFFRGRALGRRHVPRSGGVLLVCNHQSFLDPVLATLALPRECHFMARDTLFAKPAFRWLIESLNAFPIKRGSADIGAIKETLRRLRDGALIVTFPEGTRTPDGAVHAMHAGMILVARKARVPVVPAVILGAFEAWPRHHRLPRPGKVIVAYGAPIAAQELAALSDEQAVQRVRGAVVALWERYRGGVNPAGGTIRLSSEIHPSAAPAAPSSAAPARG